MVPFAGGLLGLTPSFQQYKVRLCRIKAQEFGIFRGEDPYSSPGHILLDGGLLHNRCTDLDDLCGRLLGLTPFSRRYKVRLCRIKTQEFPDFGGGCIRSQAGDTLLDSTLLHNRLTDLDALCRRLLGLMPASQPYKVPLCRIKAHEFTGFCGGCIRYQAGDILLDGRLLHNRSTDLDALCGRLLGLTPASQRYMVRLCRIKAHEFAVFCGGCIRSQAGDILLDGGLLHNHFTDRHALCGRLLGLTPASHRDKVRLCRINTHESANPSESGLSTGPRTRWQIPPQPLLRS